MAARPCGRTATPVAAGILVATYLGACLLGGHSTLAGLDPLDRIAFGGASRSLIGQGEVWRVGLAPLLHADPLHLALNVALLMLLGWRTERNIGSRWTILTLVLGAVAGTLFSLESNPAARVSIGASGALCALLVVGLVADLRHGARRRSGRIAITAGLLLISLAPLVRDLRGGEVDIAAHLGGLVAGLSTGFVLWRVWPAGADAPERPLILAWFARASAVAIAVCVGCGSWAWPAYRERYAAYASQEGLSTAASDPEALDRLIARYPADPRPQIARAGQDIAAGRYGSARARLERAVTQPTFVRDLGPTLAMRATVLLSYAALLDGDAENALAIAEPVCAYARADRSLREILNDLAARHICTASGEHAA